MSDPIAWIVLVGAVVYGSINVWVLVDIIRERRRGRS